MNSIDILCSDLSFFEQFENLCLHRHVERRRRLVGDQQVRPVGERHGDHHPLALAARQFVRIGAEAFFRFLNADLVQQFEDAVARRRVEQTLVQSQDLTDLTLHRMQGIERRHRPPGRSW